MPHYCHNHKAAVAFYGPVKGKFYCETCKEIAYAESKKSPTAYRVAADETNYNRLNAMRG